jgi:hypothetical protein
MQRPMPVNLMKTEQLKAVMETPHPAALWAEEASLDPLQVDCVTTVMLKILDHKCKMSPEEQIALMAIYGVVKHRQGLLLNEEVHQAIHNAMHVSPNVMGERIHQLRQQAEAQIPKPVMKYFKRYLRESLYGV